MLSEGHVAPSVSWLTKSLHPSLFSRDLVYVGQEGLSKLLVSVPSNLEAVYLL